MLGKTQYEIAIYACHAQENAQQTQSRVASKVCMKAPLFSLYLQLRHKSSQFLLIMHAFLAYLSQFVDIYYFKAALRELVP
jgi:hypothetical protein